MYQQFKLSKSGLYRTLCTTMAAVMVVALLPIFFSGRASAGAISSKSITMSSSKVSDTGVTYTIAFTPSSTDGAVAIDFCQTAVIGSTCTVPLGFSAASGSGSLGTGWDAATYQGTSITAKRTTTALAAATAVTVTVTGITNPSSTGTFYARIMTWSTVALPSAQGWAYNGGSPTEGSSMTDYGAVGLSTANLITINATVQEFLLFCVTSTDTTGLTDAACPGTAPTLTLGNNGTPNVLTYNSASIGYIYSHLSTNAIAGTSIRLKSNSASCAGLLLNGVCGIKGVEAASGTANATSLITSAIGGFGVLGVNALALGADPAYSTNTLVPAVPYSSNASSLYGMNNDVYGTNGGILANSNTAAPIYGANTQYTFAAVAAQTTPAGVYSNTFTMIATGTF